MESFHYVSDTPPRLLNHELWTSPSMYSLKYDLEFKKKQLPPSLVYLLDPIHDGLIDKLPKNHTSPRTHSSGLLQTFTSIKKEYVYTTELERINLWGARTSVRSAGSNSSDHKNYSFDDSVNLVMEEDFSCIGEDNMDDSSDSLHDNYGAHGIKNLSKISEFLPQFSRACLEEKWNTLDSDVKSIEDSDEEKPEPIVIKKRGRKKRKKNPKVPYTGKKRGRKPKNRTQNDNTPSNLLGTKIAKAACDAREDATSSHLLNEPEKKRRLGPRSKSGCWTCRVRHKACPEDRPSCGQCIRLNLECDYLEQRPLYMYDPTTQAAKLKEIRAITNTQKRVNFAKRKRSFVDDSIPKELKQIDLEKESSPPFFSAFNTGV